MSIPCGGCAATWTGIGTAHCGGCHETFLGVSAFDYHRRGGGCVPPWEAEKVVDGVTTPAPLVRAGDVWVPENRHTGEPGHFAPRSYEAWTFAGDDS